MRRPATTGAVASLPGSPLSTNIAPSRTGERDEHTAGLCADGTLGNHARKRPYDGIVTQFHATHSRSLDLFFGSFDGTQVEHEIDEVRVLDRTKPQRTGVSIV